MAGIRKIWRVLVPAWLMTLSAVAVAGPDEDANAGLDAVKAGNYAHAVQLFTRAIASGKLSSDDREYAYVQRGTAYLDMGNSAAAALDFQRALKVKPGDTDASDGLSQARAHGGGSRGAHGGGNPSALAEAGMNALKTGAPAQAVTLFTQAINTGRIQGDDLELAYLSRGQAYVKIGNFHEAVQDLDQALQLKADDSDAQQAMIEALGKMPPAVPAPGFDAGACKHNMKSQGGGGGVLGGFLGGALGVPQTGAGKTFTSFVDYQGLDRVNALAGLYRAMAQNSPAGGANWQVDAVSLHNGFLSAQVAPGDDSQIKLEAHIEASGSVTRVTMQEEMSGPMMIVDIKGSMCRTFAQLPR